MQHGQLASNAAETRQGLFPPSGWLERHAPLRALVEAAGLVVGLAIVSSWLGGVISPAHGALLCITAVVAAGIRHGFATALLVSFGSMVVMSFFHLEPHFSFRAERVEDWVTLGSFGLASFLTGNLAGRFRRQLEETRAIAEQNELLSSTSRRLAAASEPEQLAAVLLDAAASVAERPAVLLLPDGSERLAGVYGATEELRDDDRAAAERAHRAATATAPSAGMAWHFLPLLGERGALGVLGVRASSALDGGQLRVLTALCHSAGVALERCRLTEEIRAAQMAADAERLRAALLSSVSHDLRTPLASIIGATSTLQDLGDAVKPADRSELLSMVIEEARRLDRFVGNLLDMTRIGTGQLRPRLAWCDVRDLIAEVVRSLHLQLAEPPLDVAIDATFPLLYVDAVLLERVIENLVHNALAHGGAGRAVAIRADVTGDIARIRVMDAGPGLAHAGRHPLLDRVAGADRRTAGSGMGLAICRAFTEALGGTLALENRRDEPGLCAEIRLPIVLQDAEAPDPTALEKEATA